MLEMETRIEEHDDTHPILLLVLSISSVSLIIRNH